MLELWGMRSTPSLPSLPGPLWPGVVAPDRVLSLSRIELIYNYAKLNCLKLTIFTFGQMCKVFANSPGDRGSIPGRAILKTKKMVFNAGLLHHHHHVMPQVRISLTLPRHSSLSFIASGGFSGLHPVSSQSCWMYVRAGRPAFALPYVEVHRSISLNSSSLLLKQCPACLVRLTWIVFVIGGRWPYSWCLVECCRQHSCVIAV